MSEFSMRLKQLRRDSHMTQAELADKIGVSKSSVNMYERGEREPSFEALEAIADTFNVTMDYLMGRDTMNNGGSEITFKGKPLESLSLDEIREAERNLNQFILEFLDARGIPREKLAFNGPNVAGDGIEITELAPEDAEFLAKSMMEAVNSLIKQRDLRLGNG